MFRSFTAYPDDARARALALGRPEISRKGVGKKTPWERDKRVCIQSS